MTNEADLSTRSAAVRLRLLPRNPEHRDDVLAFMRSVDEDFDPPLASRLDLEEYVERVLRLAEVVVVEGDSGLVGLSGCYANDAETRRGFLTYLAVAKGARGSGVARLLLAATLSRAWDQGMVEVAALTPARRRGLVAFYNSAGFATVGYVPRPDGSSSAMLVAPRLLGMPEESARMLSSRGPTEASH